MELRQRFLTANGIQHPSQQRQNNQRRNLWQTQLEELIRSSVLLFTLNPRKARRTRFPAELLLPQFGQSSRSGLAQCGSGFEDLSKVRPELDFGDRVTPGGNSARADNNSGADHRGGQDPFGNRFILQRQVGQPFQADAGQIRLLWRFASGWKARPTKVDVWRPAGNRLPVRRIANPSLLLQDGLAIRPTFPLVLQRQVIRQRST